MLGPGFIGSGESGNRSLDRAGAKGKTDTVNRGNHLIYAKSFCAYGPGKENSVEKAQNSGNEPGGGKEHGA